MNIIFNASAGTGKTWQVTELYCALVLGTENEFLPDNRDPVAPEKILLMTFTDNAAAELRGRVAAKVAQFERSADPDSGDLARRIQRHLPAAHISTIHAFCAGLLRENALELGLSPECKTLEEDDRDALLDEVLKSEIFDLLETDPDFREFCCGVSAVLGDNEYAVINTVRSLLEKAASRGLDLSEAEALLPDPELTVGRSDFKRIRDELSARGCSQKTAVDALNALDECLADFPAGLQNLKKFGRIKELKELSQELSDLKERFESEFFYKENVDRFRAFARCLSRCAVRFSEEKKSRDVVDFSDQLLFSRDLLDRHIMDVPPFEWIIVDEVQDTSRVQCEVIKALWKDQTHLVVCGDRKQSVYAWRSADPNVMPDLEKEMRVRGSCKQIDLRKSYRSKEKVLDAVNGLFEGIYCSYDALEALENLAGEKPCVEFLQADHEDQHSQEEMDAVARRIQLLVGGGSDWRPEYGHNEKIFTRHQPVCYGDILILLRRSTHQPVLEKSLRAAGIPYTSGGRGRALFQQQEVRDLLLLLQVLTQPRNDLALVGFLRSPFVNMPDDEIVRCGWDGRCFDREILRRNFFESGSIDAERILRYRAMTGSRLPSQLVRDMVSETAFDADWTSQSGGEQHLANFKKALDWLRDTERVGRVLIGDVVRRFERAVEKPPRQGAAEALLPDPDQNAVTIMTVHGAKGLTKRVCFVPDASFRLQTDRAFACLSQSGCLELAVSDLSGRKAVTPGWKSAREKDREVQDLELKNLFYVAMTRARDLVVFSGAGTQTADGWVKLAGNFIADAKPEILTVRNFSEIPLCEVKPSCAEFSFSSVSFNPLRPSLGTERKPVTEMVDYHRSAHGQSVLTEDRRAFGTLGHLLLEELAVTHWVGDAGELINFFEVEAGDVETDLLIPRVEAVCDFLRKETSMEDRLFTEFTFVMEKDGQLLDGSIDLLIQERSGKWKIFDYKFSDESPAEAMDIYRPQLAVYREAIQRLNLGAEVSAALIVAGKTVQVQYLQD